MEGLRWRCSWPGKLVLPGPVTTIKWGTDKPAPTDQGLILAGVGRVP